MQDNTSPPNSVTDQSPQYNRLWLFTMDKHSIMAEISQKAAAMEPGANFTLPELLDGVWELLNPNIRKQAAKEFKAMVFRNRIPTVNFLPDGKRKGNPIYIRR